MDELKLIYEFEDRHVEHLVYEGAYQFAPQVAGLNFESMFKDWRQRIYRFDGDLGASVVLYTPLSQETMTWDLLPARFFGEEPFSFQAFNVLKADLHWREVQRFLDQLKARHAAFLES